MPAVEAADRLNDAQRPLIAVAQYAPQLGRVEQNRNLSTTWIQTAADRGASLVVLPECCVTGLVFRNRKDLLELAEGLDGPTVEAWRAHASRSSIYVIGGMAERDGDMLFNTAVVAAPDGSVCSYRKTHVFGHERELFALGDRLVALDTPWGRIGLAICYDLWFPEMVRTLAKAGASLIASPSNWFVPPRQAADGPDAPAMAFHLASAAACSNEVTIACADRTGDEGGTTFIGGSFIVGPNGRPLAGPASREADACLLAQWPDPSPARNLVQSHLQTRRDALYAQPVAIVSGDRRSWS